MGKKAPITKEMVKRIANGPITLIEDWNGMVIGNSQALARMCLLLEEAIDAFSKDILKACDNFDDYIEEDK